MGRTPASSSSPRPCSPPWMQPTGVQATELAPAPSLGPGCSPPVSGFAHLLRGEAPQQLPLHFGARLGRFEKRAPGLQLQTAPTARLYQVPAAGEPGPRRRASALGTASSLNPHRDPRTLNRPSATTNLKRGRSLSLWWAGPE